MQDVDPKVIEILPNHFAKNTPEVYSTQLNDLHEYMFD